MTLTTDTTKTATFSVPSHLLVELDGRLKKLGRRATKLGIDVPAYKVVGEEDKFVSGLGTVRFSNIVISGPTVRVDGWNFVASVEHTEAGNAIKTVPGFTGDIPTEYRTGDPICEHCNLKRRRNDSFLCTNGDGGWKMIGRNCLADFIGRDPAELVLGLGIWAAVGSICEEENWGNGKVEWSFDFGRFITAVFHTVRRYGWVSKGTAYETGKAATVHEALWLVTPAFADAEIKAKADEWRLVSDVDKEAASKALSWTREHLAGIATESRSGYENNLFIALSKPGVTVKDAGIVGSLIVGYNKHVESELRCASDAKKSNEHLGTVGERITGVSLTLVALRSFEGSYGTTHLHTFETEAGDSVKWFGSSYFSDKDAEADIGDTVKANWKVTKHEIYKGRKSTIVNRPTKKTVIKAS